MFGPRIPNGILIYCNNCETQIIRKELEYCPNCKTQIKSKPDVIIPDINVRVKEMKLNSLSIRTQLILLIMSIIFLILIIIAFINL